MGDFREISETLTLAKLYVDNLNELKDEILTVEKQVLNTFRETQDNIKETFSNLKNSLRKQLEKREQELLRKAEKIKNEGLVPLKQCSDLINTNITTTLTLMEDGSRISNLKDLEVIGFLERASILGNLPEVPESKEVPYLSFYHEPTIELELEGLCAAFGEVFRTAPIQIKTITAKPGALLIEWHENYEDKIKDIQEFKLQRAFGDVAKQKNLAVNFIDCYTGPDSQCIIRDIQINQPYSFRVCCKFDGTTEWSPWSVPQVGLTNIKWFSWKADSEVTLSHDNKIATIPKGGRVLSDGAQVSLNDSIEFTIIETDPTSDMTLILSPDPGLDRDNLFTVDKNGIITINGSKKSTILSSFGRGMKVCFTLEPIGSGKVRVHVDCEDKRVTYDWTVGEVDRLFFACQMTLQWKVMVE